MKKMDRLYQEYQNGTISWETFVSATVDFMRPIMYYRHRLSAEERREIISDFYPRMQYIVQNYSDRGSSFDAYFLNSLSHCCRSYIRERARVREQETYLPLESEMEQFVPQLVSEPNPDPLHGCYQQEYEQILGTGRRDALRRQVLFIFCKNAPLLTQVECERLGSLLDLPGGWVESVIEYTLHHSADRTRRRTRLRERRDVHYAAMLRLERKMCEETGNENAEELRSRYRRHRRLWLSHVKRLKRLAIHLSNREIAVLLGISKGSVDSALYTLGNRLENLEAAE